METVEHEDAEGKIRVILKDPVSEKFYYLSKYEYIFLLSLDGTLTVAEAVEKLKSHGHYYALNDAETIVNKAGQAGLLHGTKYESASYQRHLKRMAKKAKRAQIFSSVYFLFIPVLNPDRFLSKTLRFVKPFASKWFGMLVLLAAPGAVYLVIEGIPRIEREYLYFFNLHNLLYLWVTLAFTKLFHEFAHAYTAKYYGLHVPQMGVAFLIFFPCLYCDTTQAWQLAERRQRMMISGAGILAEAVLAVFSAYVWYFTKPGIINSLTFYLMAISLISTLLFNGNPLLKFDGYFILIDLIKLPNLATRAAAHIKYLFMNRVMGIARYANNANTRREAVIFTTYGISSFIYRIFLYTGICFGVYYRFDKSIGILLGMLALALFVVRPVLKGVLSLVKVRKEIRPRPVGGLVFLSLLAVLVAVLAVPIPRNSVYPCYLASLLSQKITVPLDALVREVFVEEGSHVAEGDILFTLDTVLLKLDLLKKETEKEAVKLEIMQLLVTEKRRGEAEAKKIRLKKLEDATDEIRKMLAIAESGVTAPFSGVVTRLDPRVQNGFRPGRGSVVGEIESEKECAIRALIPENDLDKVREGQEVKIRFGIETGLVLMKKIDEIRSFSEHDLGASPFSSRFGGEVATEPQGTDRQDVPLEAQYQCIVHFSDNDGRIPLGMTGSFVVQAPPRSILMATIDRLVKAFNLESLL